MTSSDRELQQALDAEARALRAAASSSLLHGMSPQQILAIVQQGIADVRFFEHTREARERAKALGIEPNSQPLEAARPIPAPSAPQPDEFGFVIPDLHPAVARGYGRQAA